MTGSIEVAPPSGDRMAGALPAGYAPVGVGLLLAIYALNYVDRQVINILAEPIKQELRLSDSQLGLLTGLAFAVIYSTLGLVIARLADRSHRPRIIVAAVCVWSAFTVACGFSQTYLQLFLLRIGVGFGEAGGAPPSHSLISDYVPRSRRASALAIFAMGIPIGTLIGLAFGGLVADAFGWRAAFLIAGAPGLLAALAAHLLLKEPRSGQQAENEHTPRVAEVVRELRSKRAFWCVSFGGAMMSFVGSGNGAFLASFFFRRHGEAIRGIAAQVNALLGTHLGSVSIVGILMGLTAGFGGIIGTTIGGRIADGATRGNDLRAYALVPAIAAVIQYPFFVSAMLVPGAVAAFTLLAVPAVLNTMWYGPTFAAVQSLVHPRTRTTAAALLQLVAVLVGVGLGPLATGLLSDRLGRVFANPGLGLQWSMILCGLAAFLAAGLFVAGARFIRDDVVA